MSKIVSYTETVSSHPVSYDDGYEAYSVSGLNQAETDSDSTNYATINLSRGESAETEIFYNFDLNIPTGATIDSVTCTAKCYISSTNSSRISTRQIQLYSGTTAKGTAYTVSNSTNEFSITPGTWTAAELNNAKIRIHAVRGSSNTTTNYSFRFYGATINVEYSVNGTAYEVNAQVTSGTCTVSPSTQDIREGESATIRIDDIDDERPTVIMDNGEIVTDSLVVHTEYPGQGTVSKAAESQTNSGIQSGSSYASYAVGRTAEDPYSSTSNMYASSNSNGYVDYSFDFSDIPSGVDISSVEVKVYGHRESSSTGTSYVAKIGLYSDSTLKSTEQEFTSTSDQLITINNPGTWTRDELQDAKLRFTVGYYGGLVCGITWNVSYVDPNSEAITYYTYTTSNVQEDHDIYIGNEISGKIIWEASASYISTKPNVSTVSGTGSVVVAGAPYTISIQTANFNSLQIKLDSYSNPDISSQFVNVGNNTYEYTITTNVSFQIIVQDAASPSNTIYVKINGTWVESKDIMIKVNGAWQSVTTVYKKVNGSWTQSTDISDMFVNNAYLKGGNV